jgi:hypothetical protein
MPVVSFVGRMGETRLEAGEIVELKNGRRFAGGVSMAVIPSSALVMAKHSATGVSRREIESQQLLATIQSQSKTKAETQQHLL